MKLSLGCLLSLQPSHLFSIFQHNTPHCQLGKLAVSRTCTAEGAEPYFVTELVTLLSSSLNENCCLSCSVDFSELIQGNIVAFNPNLHSHPHSQVHFHCRSYKMVTKTLIHNISSGGAFLHHFGRKGGTLISTFIVVRNTVLINLELIW